MPEATALVMPPIASTSSISFQAFLGQFGGQALDIVGAAQRIDDIGDAGFFLQDQLGVARDAREKSVGSAIASSSALVCSDWVPPSTAAIASIGGADDVVVGVLLLQADTPEVWQWVRSIRSEVFFAPNSVMIRCHSTRAARSLATSMKKFMPMAKKKLSRPANLSTSMPAPRRISHIPCRRPGEGQLLHLVRAGFLHVVAGDRDRVELRHLGEVYSMMSEMIRIEGSGG
jgi:hypothetical protein